MSEVKESEVKEREIKDEAKAFMLKVEGGKFKISVDPNKDGQPVLDLAIDLSEIPDEILGLFQ